MPVAPVVNTVAVVCGPGHNVRHSRWNLLIAARAAIPLRRLTGGNGADAEFFVGKPAGTILTTRGLERATESW